MESSDYELLAQQVSALNAKVAALEGRLTDVEKVNARLEIGRTHHGARA